MMNLTRMAIYIQSPATITMKKSRVLLRSKKMDLIYFIFLFIFYFLLDLFFYFLFLEQLGLGLIGHAVTSVTNVMA